MRDFLDEWSKICNSDNIEHLTVPRVTLFGWGMMILILQTISIFVRFEIFLQFAGWAWIILFFLFRQYCRIWKRYYSVFWPVAVHTAALIAAIYIKARYL